MLDRDSYWLNRLHYLIATSPGLSLSQLVSRSRTLTTEERSNYLHRLLRADRIRMVDKYRRNGTAVHYLWPNFSTVKPADALTTQLLQARKLLADATAAIDEATRLVSQTTAPANGPTPAVSAD